MTENKQSVFKQVASGVSIAVISGAILAWIGIDKLSNKEGRTANQTSAAVTDNARLSSDCLNEPNYRSLPSTRETTFTITNSSQETIVGYWLDFQGNRQRYFVLQPEQRVMQNTFVGHYWVITDVSGKCNRVLVAPGDFIIR